MTNRGAYAHDEIVLDDIAGREVDPSNSTITDLLDELSNDGRTLVDLALDTPNDLLELMRGSKTMSPLSCIKKYVQGLDWTIKRFGNAVADVREAMWLVTD